jgi:addiction module HigA family antidote
MGEAITKVGMAPVHPGQFLREEVVDEIGLSIPQAAEALGVESSVLTEVLDGRSSLSPEMALRIEKAFGIDMAMMLRMQAWHDTYAMRQRADDVVVQPYRAA